MNEVQFIYSCCLALVKREIPGWSENRHKNLKRKICLRFFTKTRQNATALTITNILTLKVKHFGFHKVALCIPFHRSWVFLADTPSVSKQSTFMERNPSSESTIFQ